MRTALITGCGGFSGQHLIRRLDSEKDLCIVGCDIVDNFPEKKKLFKYEMIDIGDRKSMNYIIGKYRPDWIFHLAGLMHGSLADLYRINCLAGIFLLEAVKEYSPESCVVVIGSAAEYGIVSKKELPITEDHPCAPVGAYGISKYSFSLAALDYAKSFGLKTVVARPFNLIGAGMPPSLIAGSVVQRIIKAVSEEKSEIAIGNLDTERDFIAVEDAVDAYCLMIQSERWGEIFNVCSGKPVSIRYIVEYLLSKAERPVSTFIDQALIRINDVRSIYGSYKKARQLLGFSPQLSLESSLHDAWVHAAAINAR